MYKNNISYLCAMGLIATISGHVEASGRYSKENDERNKRECIEAVDNALPQIDAAIQTGDNLLLRNADSFITKHNVRGFEARDIVNALKATHNALFFNAEKLKKQTIGYKDGEVANKMVCESAANQAKAEYEKAYGVLAKKFDEFSYNFLKCPKELTLEDTREIYAMQTGKKDSYTIRVKGEHGYIDKTVLFKVDPQNMGDRFSNKPSAKLKAPKNNLEKVVTVGEKTYCTYKWDGYQKGWNSSIYYDNTVN